MTSERAQMTDEDLYDQCISNFYTVAIIQGRLSYLLMSIHAVNPRIWFRFFDYDPRHVLFSNMIYGTTVYIFSRPSMRPISVVNRLIISILGSCMFNYSSALFFEYLRTKLEHRPILVTILGFLSGRIFMLHFLAYLYHVDKFTRIDRHFPRNSTFDSTINNPK